MNNYKLTIVIAISLTLFSCSKDDDLIMPQTGDNIVFSNSPIDLQGIDAKFAKDIAYDNKSDALFDIWMPTSSTPTAVVFYIHGGGFLGGDKDFVYDVQKGGEWDFPTDIRSFLSNNIAFVTVNYTLLSNNETEGVIKCLNDVKRALQSLRNRASVFNIDKDKIVLTGNSAGASTSLWLAFNDDLKDESNSDFVLRESTRVKGVAIRNTQATLDLERWSTDVFVDYGISFNDFASSNENRITQFYGISDFDTEYHTPEIDAYRAQVDNLDLMTIDDPEFWVENVLISVVAPTTNTIINHHAFHARELKEKADAIGLSNVTYYGRDPIIFSDPSNENWVDFSIRKLNE